MHYIAYCDESEDKGRYYSNFYGGALIEASRREGLEAELRAAKSDKLKGELKWTKISEYNERYYIHFVEEFFRLVATGFVKVRIMFTQNVNTVDHLKYDDPDAKYFKLYYQFLKHAFGLRYCNPGASQDISVSVLIDNAPDTRERLESFKTYLSSLSDFPVWKASRVRVAQSAIMEVVSDDHIILQAVDIVLGSMQFRLNELHREIPPGKRRRGKRTRAKERVYKRINSLIREIYPGFNIGVSTGQMEGPQVRWSHPYRHWCFIPNQSVRDLDRGKKASKQAPQPST